MAGKGRAGLGGLWRSVASWFGRMIGQAGGDRWAVYRRARRGAPDPGPRREALISDLIFERQRHQEHRHVEAYDRLIRRLRLGVKGTKRREE
ncbi:MAG: hypothetical protein RDU89_09680 [bacterium]|nr:hypothetical protein [bacterium]